MPPMTGWSMNKSMWCVISAQQSFVIKMVVSVQRVLFKRIRAAMIILIYSYVET